MSFRTRWHPLVAAILLLVLSVPLVVVASDTFDDVDDDNVFHNDIAWLANSGVTKGCNPPANTNFCPSDVVTREQMAAFLRRLAEGAIVDAATVEGQTVQQIIASASAGGPPIFVDPALPFVGINRETQISSNEVFGVRYEGGADEYGGMYVETSNADGWPFYGYATNGAFRAWTYYDPGNSGDPTDPAKWKLWLGGERLSSSTFYGLDIHNGVTDGMRINDTVDDGIQVGSIPDYPNYGLYIPTPGVAAYGLWPNTADPSGEWALYTVDKISANNVALASLSLVAKVGGSGSLSVGDVAAVTGVAEPLAGGHSRLPTVTRAAATGSTGMIGVVESRMVFEPPPGKDEPALMSADGDAEPGNYVSLVVYGVADVRVSGGISRGDRLTASDNPGAVRALETRVLDGMEIAEGAPIIGIALEEASPGATMVPVFVSMR